MTRKRERRRVARELPPVGTTLTATYRGQSHTAEIVDAKELPARRGVKYREEVFSSLSAAGRAVTSHATNGWKFWQPAEPSEESTPSANRKSTSSKATP